MVKEAQRKCSHCGQQGHNSRTCTTNNNVNGNSGNGNGNGNGGIGKGHSFKLFGVNIMENKEGGGAMDLMKKSRSMGNLAALSGGRGLNDVAAGAGDDDDHDDHDHDHDHEGGYLSDGFIHNKRHKAARERKRGKPWTEEEHRTFLAGLSKLGKGDWRGISMKYVRTRTPTQVASHAQKYFIRQQAPKDKKKRRSSLFDMPLLQSDDMAHQRHPVSSMIKPTSETSSSKPTNGSQVILPENNPAEILNRFPQLCLDNYTASNYLVPYGAAFPGSVQPCPMINIGRPSYLYNAPNVVYGSVDSSAPVVFTHPSGIPPPQSPTSSPSIKAATRGDSSADQIDGLELKIGQPQPKQGSELAPSPATGAIRVT